MARYQSPSRSDKEWFRIINEWNPEVKADLEEWSKKLLED